ncbi:MAG: NADPH-dependent glutamate synthase [Armatimonadia bacterium]|nr:NADPH-dependent glutamate synthase [Armatimonadia bacterium]
MAIERQDMPEQEAEERRGNFSEVPFGYDDDLAQLEAKRCLECPSAPCIAGCPVGIDIPRFVAHVALADYAEAARTLKEASSLAAICGRVCPQEEQCEAVCVRGKTGEPVAIGRLERFVADWEREHPVDDPEPLPPTGKKVAIIGSGPSGLTAAGDLARKGHKVVIHEALHEPGGVLMYGIPEFRLPKSIVRSEIEAVKRLGADVEVNAVAGRLFTIPELLEEEGFDAVYIATGAGLPVFLNLPGENLIGVFSANEYLTRANLMSAWTYPYTDTPIIQSDRVAVIGAGNTAMDAARTALRLGADHVAIVYRRSRAEMPARIEEIEHAEQEGVEMRLLTNPIEYLGDEDGRLVGLRCVRMELGEPDSSGRRRPIPIEGSEHVYECDTAIVAVGTRPNPLIQSTTPDLLFDKWGRVMIDPETRHTASEGVFAGGDIVSGAATVIAAMGDGKSAARHIHAYLEGELDTAAIIQSIRDRTEE